MFLVCYFQFIIKETGQEKFGDLANITQEVKAWSRIQLTKF